jgi:hypothetical protein
MKESVHDAVSTGNVTNVAVGLAASILSECLEDGGSLLSQNASYLKIDNLRT